VKGPGDAPCISEDICMIHHCCKISLRVERGDLSRVDDVWDLYDRPWISGERSTATAQSAASRFAF
jgi:hypothetical protein